MIETSSQRIPCPSSIQLETLFYRFDSDMSDSDPVLLEAATDFIVNNTIGRTAVMTNVGLHCKSHQALEIIERSTGLDE